MATKLLTFLGARPMEETTYVYQGQECTTRYMAEAAARFFAPDEVLVAVTEEARRANLPQLTERLAGFRTPQPIDIPSGRSEDELWAIFDRLQAHIAAGDAIVFDVTNAFRSLPILAFLATVYVRVLRGAELVALIYGAFDASAGGRTPVFDLTPFVRLLDWTAATDAFLKYGRADDMVRLVSGIGEGAAPGTQRQTQQLAESLGELTAALQTSRPAEVAETAHRFSAQVSRRGAGAGPAARPFELLLEQVAGEYGRLGHDNPRRKSDALVVVERQFDMISWYVQRRLYVQAITMMREWLVSLVVAHAGEDMFNGGARKQAEKLLRGEASRYDAGAVPDLEQVRMVWEAIRPVRNSVAHTGMTYEAPTAAAVEVQITSAYALLERLVR